MRLQYRVPNGWGRFPVILHKEQWERLLAMADEIKKFIADNQGRLKVKV